MTDAETKGAPEVRAALIGAPKHRPLERAIKVVLLVCGLVSVATSVGIVVALAVPTFEFLQDVPITAYLFGTTWSPLFSDPSYGVLPLVTGTLVITAVACIVCLPLGLGAAIYMSDYANDRTRRTVKPMLEVLAGVPTVVFGFFTLEFITPLLQKLFPFLDLQGSNGLSAGIVMGIMIIPTVASLSEDSLSAVPRNLREAAYGLGASRAKVASKVVVPAALSGIVAAFVLGISRAIGETMIVTIAAGNQPNLTLNPVEAMQTMTAFIAQAGLGDQSTGSIGYKTIFTVGATLFVATFILNMVSIKFVRKYREHYA